MTASRFSAAAAVVVFALLTSAAAASPSAAPASLAKKRCHLVKKKVHGKVRRVRVCTKPKPKPKVKSVSVSLASGAQVKATVGGAGGSVSAGGATLEVPAGALTTSTEVTVTPVSTVRGLPRGLKLVAGVQFGPENLALEKPATLTINTGGSGLHAIAWFGLGKEVSRYPSARATGGIQIRVAHFSGVALVQGPGWTGLNDPAAALRARFNAEVKPRLATAASEDPLTSGTFAAAFAWEREVELLGLGGDFAAEKAQIRDALERAVQNAIDRASTRCADQHDLTQIERLTRLDRIANLFRISITGGSGFERALKCAHFELDIAFELTFDHAVHTEIATCVADDTEQGEIDVTVERMPLALSGSTTEGEAPLTVTKFEDTHHIDEVCSQVPPLHCTISSVSASPLRNAHVALTIDLTGGSPEVKFAITPGAMTLNTRADGGCPGGPKDLSGPFDAPLPFGNEAGTGTTTYILTLVPSANGHFAGGDTYVTYGPETISLITASIEHVTMTRSFVLRHTPEL